ncbi:hypothetical protein [Streptomyces pratensis]|uniref:hypothetical protein n=1 Tax=Streptomyces pratensis TaxID=1169025 RepID=UPI00301B0BEF
MTTQVIVLNGGSSTGGSDIVHRPRAVPPGPRPAAAIADGRETARGDRARDTGAAQAATGHRGVAYDREAGAPRTEPWTARGPSSPMHLSGATDRPGRRRAVAPRRPATAPAVPRRRARTHRPTVGERGRGER